MSLIGLYFSFTIGIIVFIFLFDPWFHTLGILFIVRYPLCQYLKWVIRSKSSLGLCRFWSLLPFHGKLGVQGQLLFQAFVPDFCFLWKYYFLRNLTGFSLISFYTFPIHKLHPKYFPRHSSQSSLCLCFPYLYVFFNLMAVILMLPGLSGKATTAMPSLP